MGEGSYVVLHPVKYKEARAALRMAEDGKSDVEKEEHVNSLLRNSIVEWDWVDDDGELLPVPADGFDIDELYNHEITFLISALLGTEQEQKN